MRVRKSFQLALNILFHSKLRSWLTIIGIVIGIAAVVAIISMSEGAKRSLEERLGGLGADVITVSPGFSRARGIGFGGGGGGGSSSFGDSVTEGKNLTYKDVLALRSLQNVKYAMGEVSERAAISFLSKSSTSTVDGVDASLWKDITTEKLSAGRFLAPGDSYSVVIGNTLATTVFERKILLNDQILIEGRSFKVVGILEQGSGIYMPITISRGVIEEAAGDHFTSISVKIADVTQSNETVNAITDKLMLSRGILDEKKKDFSVFSPTSIQQTITQTLNTIALFLGAIAAISLLVGAVGIANSMFTSVLERTRDIGIMKAIGAQNKDVLLIFLFNAGLIGLVGGIGGMIIGIGVSSAISSAGGLTPSGGGGGRGFAAFGSSIFISPQTIFLILLFAIAVGMIAGAIPAWRASRLNPVDALRYE